MVIIINTITDAVISSTTIIIVIVIFDLLTSLLVIICQSGLSTLVGFLFSAIFVVVICLSDLFLFDGFLIFLCDGFVSLPYLYFVALFVYHLTIAC